MKPMLAAAAICAVATAAAAQDAPAGDPAAGESAFRQCQACHVVRDAEGNTLAGKASKTGPNLYGIPGRQAGTVEDFRYGDDLVAAGEAGLVWDEESFVAYVSDPTGFLRDHLGDKGARGKMTFKVRDAQDAHDLWAYLVSVSPES